MKRITTTALAIIVAMYGYSQTYLPLTGGTLTGSLTGTTATFTSTALPYIDFKTTNTVSTGWQYKQLSFSDATATELYTIGYNHPNLQFMVRGVQTMNLTPSGNVGIGTTSPASGLQIAKAGDDLQLTLGSAAVNRDISMNMFSGPVNAEVLRFQSGHRLIHGLGSEISKQSFLISGTEIVTLTSGNVGIGTTTPVRKLVVSNAGAEGLEFGPGNTPGRSLIGSYNRSGGAVNALDFHANAYNFAGGPVTFSEPVIGTSATFNGVTAQTNNFISNVAGGGFYHSAVNAGMYGDNGYLRITNWDTQAKGINIQVATGNVAIGTSNPQGYKLAVAGNVIAESVKVALQGAWPDFVFKPDHRLPSLPEVEKFIQTNKHLSEIPSAAKVAKEGINLGEMDAKLLKKIEELTLYLIEQNKRIEELEKQIKK